MIMFLCRSTTTDPSDSSGKSLLGLLGVLLAFGREISCNQAPKLVIRTIFLFASFFHPIPFLDAV